MVKNVLITQFNGVMYITHVDRYLCFVGIYIRKILGFFSVNRACSECHGCTTSL